VGRRLSTQCARAALAVALLVPGLAREVAFAHLGVDALDERSSAEVAKHPDSAEAHLMRARVLQMKRDWDAALEEIEEAATRGADPDVVGGTRGSVYLEAGFPRMAKVEFDRVLARRPGAYGLMFERGRAWLAIGNAEAAARDFGDAIAKGPQPTPEQVIARRDALLALGKKEDALRALDAGMTRVGRVVSLQMPAVDLEVELGRYEAALRRLDDLSRSIPTPNPLWIARRGEVLEKAGRASEARVEYAKALSLIEARAVLRHGAPFEDLKRRLETALASANDRGDRK
jgi:tetratricopeptide (TPR) repeat protein